VLVEPCIKAGTSERGVCGVCGAPWERVVERSGQKPGRERNRGGRTDGYTLPAQWENGTNPTTITTTGWRPTCSCYDGPYHRDFQRARSERKRHQQNAQRSWLPRARRRPGLDKWKTAPAVVLDMFGGAGTVGLVAEQLERDCILVDLKDEYGEMAEWRILSSLGPMFTRVEVTRDPSTGSGQAGRGLGAR